MRRWRVLHCFMGEDREQEAEDVIQCYVQEGYKAKVWSPLPSHKTSGHIHVAVLCTLAEKLVLGLNIRRKYGTRLCPKIPWLLEELKKVRGF